MLLYLLIGPLVVWRIVYALQEETGPWAILMRFRAWAASRDSGKHGSFYDGFSCFFCLSVWVSGLYCLFLGLNLFEWTAATLAVSAVAIFIGTAFNKANQ